MPGSGQLGLSMAEEFGLPHSAVTTVIKALRSDRVLSIKGRGSSAAQMTVADAAAITVGIMSGAVSAEIPSITRRLLEMPSRHFVRPVTAPSSDPLAPAPHRFLDGFSALFDGGWDDSAAGVDAEDEMDGVRIVLAVDGNRREGFAVIEARDEDGAPIKNFYSTQALRAGVSHDENPSDFGLLLYHKPPRFVFAASIDGRALAALKRALADPVSKRRSGVARNTGSSEDV